MAMDRDYDYKERLNHLEYLMAKVIGSVYPIADSRYDEEIAKNIQMLGDIAETMVENLVDIYTKCDGSHFASVTECGKIAEGSLRRICGMYEDNNG